MNVRIRKSRLSGEVNVPQSKSVAHRMLIAGFMSGNATFDRIWREIYQPSNDILATRLCLCNMQNGEKTILIDESGSTLRFLLPLSMSLGGSYTFLLGERLSKRPITPLLESLEEYVSWKKNDRTITVTGHLEPGDYRVDGSVSSQFVSGMLLALSALPGHSTLRVAGLSSKPYVDMTLEILRSSGITIHSAGESFEIYGKDKWELQNVQIEGDWSNGAIWHAANFLGCDIQINGLESQSVQGDRVFLDILSRLSGREISRIIDVDDIPDLAPCIAACAVSLSSSCHVDMIHAGRLRFKESDRAFGIVDIVRSLGGNAVFLDLNGGTLRICGGGLKGGEMDGRNDHRLIMMGVLLSMVCDEDVKIYNIDGIEKSYPMFFQELKELGAQYNMEES